jgi:hypothetical protein
MQVMLKLEQFDQFQPFPGCIEYFNWDILREFYQLESADFVTPFYP